MKKPVKKAMTARSELRYLRLFETIYVGILVLDYETRKITDANPFITRLSGYSTKELLGKKISDLGLFDDEVTGKKIFAALKKGEKAEYDNVILTTARGETKIVEVMATTYEENGKQMLQCIIRDLTEKRKAQRELFETKKRLEALMNALPVGVTFSTDATCEFITGNPTLIRHLEMAPGDNISKTAKNKDAAGTLLEHCFEGRPLKPSEMPMQRAVKEKKQVGPMEIEVALPSGKKWLMEAIAAPIFDAEGKVIASVAVNIDLTERKRAEEASRLEKVIEQEKLKFTFIADAAHELRTPLAIIKGNVDLGLRQKNSAAVEERFRAIDSEVIHLADLLSDLSLLTSKESEFKRKIVSSKVNLTKLLQHVVKRHKSFASERNITLTAEHLPEVSIVGDEFYLKRVFSNIISNAIAYGKEGGYIKVYGEIKGGSVSISIEDNGIGISEKDLPHVFERFYRTDSSRSKDTGGSGLGLTIVKWITEAHGGTVSAKSIEGEGSTFTVSFPLPEKTQN